MGTDDGLSTQDDTCNAGRDGANAERAAADKADPTLVTPQDLADYAFAHDVHVAPDGTRAFFELTRVDMEANRYRTDIWAVDVATNEPRQLTSSGEEGHFEVCDDGSVLFVSKRRVAEQKAAGGRAASAPHDKASDPTRATDLFRIDPTGGEAQLAATIPGLAVSDWRQLDANRFVLRCREKADPTAPVVEIEEIPFFENGGTYMAGTRWGLWLLDLARLESGRVAGSEALQRLTLPDEEVGDWALTHDRSRVVFASRRFASGMRPVTDKLWALELPTSGAPDAATPARTLVDDAPYRRSMLTPFRDGVLYLATDMHAHGINEDPHPWWASTDGSALPVRVEESEPDLHYGCAISSDSVYGGGLEAKAADGAWYFLSTEFDHIYLRRMDADGSMARVVDIPGAVTCFDTADGRTFWYVAMRGCDLPEVYRLDVDAPGASEETAGASVSAPFGGSDAHVRETRVTHFSDALAGKRLAAPEAFTFESDGDTLTGYVLVPAGYEPGDGRTYPGVLEVHGGPKVAYGTVLSQEMQCLAAHGYFVFFTNPHGSAGHGVAFADIRGHYGQQDYADLMTFTDEVLRRYPAVDPARLAVMGGSYGGFMTNWVIGHTDRFRCANSQRSIANYMTKCLDSDIGYWVNMPETTGWLPGDGEVDVAGLQGGADETTVLPVVGADVADGWDADEGALASADDRMSAGVAEVAVGGEAADRRGAGTGAAAGGSGVSAHAGESGGSSASGLPPVEALAFAGDNPRRIWAQSPLAFAANVTTPTLFLHSDEDYRCPLNEGMQMFTALQLRGVPSRLVIFKGECHGLSRGGKPRNRVRRLEEILAWYRRWLDGEAESATAMPNR